MAKDNYKDVVIDNDAIVNTNAEQDVPTFPEGEQKREFVKETVTTPEGEVLSTERLGEKNGELSPNPSFPYIEYIVYEGERYLSSSSLYNQYITALEKEKDGEVLTDFEKKLLEDAVLCRSSQITEERNNPFDEKDVYENADQDGIKVHTQPHNFVGGIFVNGKPVSVSGDEESSDDTNVYRFNRGDVLTEEIAAKLKSGDIILVENHNYVINKINSDHAWFRGQYTDGSVEGKITTLLLNWEEGEELTITSNEVSGGGGTQLYKHRIEIPSGYGYMELVSTRGTPYTSIDEIVNSQIIFSNQCVVNDFGIKLTCVCGIASELGVYQLLGYTTADTSHSLKYYNLDNTKLQFPSSVTEL